MKKLYILFFTLLVTVATFGQTTILQESFETDGNGSRYTTSVPEFSDGGGDFFLRTDGTGISSSYQVSGQDGAYYFSAMDTDGDGNPTTITMAFDNVDISSYTDLTFLIGVAEDDDGSNEDWDDVSSFIVEIDIDNSGSFTKILQFEAIELRPDNSSSSTNKEPALDTDFDGVGDGTRLTSTFQDFTYAIGSGSVIDIKLTFTNLKNGDEDIAIDNIRLVDGYVAAPALFLTDGPASGSTLNLSPEELTGDLEFSTANFLVGEPGTAGEEDGYISWTIDLQGGGLHDSGFIYNTSLTYPITSLSPDNTYILNAELLDNAGASLSPAVIYNLTVIVGSYTVVTDIAALRADVATNGIGGYYEITGAALVTHTDGFNNRQWVQDTNISGILITEEGADADITTYSVGDNVTGLKGGTDEDNGILIFLPTTDSGVVASSGNTVTPQIVTITDFNTNYEDYESELVELEDVTFDDGDGVATFSTGTNYDVSSNAGANIVIMRTDYFSADYIGEIIPSTELPSLVAIAGRFNTTAQVYARSLSDFTLGSESFEIKGFEMYPNPTNLGYVNISSKNNTEINISVFNVLGKQVINETLTNKRLDVSNLKAGVYIMKATEQDAVSTKKLVIK